MNNENGNGNGHGIFTLAPKTDPDTIAVLVARRNCRADDRLNRSMKAFFDEIADRALNPEFYDVKGIVAVSDTVIGKTFGVSNRTVFTWKRMIEACGYAWQTYTHKSNMWGITTYHLNCLHKPQQQKRTDADGTYGTGSWRHFPVNPGLGARTPGQSLLPLPGSRHTPPETETPDLRQISGLARKKLRVSPETNFGSGPKPASGETRSQLRVSPETNFGPDPKPASGETRSELPVRPEADCRHIQAKVLGSGSSKGGKGTEAPPADALELDFKRWEVRLDDMRNSDLRKVEEIVKREYQAAKSETSRGVARRKLVAIRLRLQGPSVAVESDTTATASTAKISPKPAAKPLPLAKRQEFAKALNQLKSR